jgi:hypothetical protein
MPMPNDAARSTKTAGTMTSRRGGSREVPLDGEMSTRKSVRHLRCNASTPFRAMGATGARSCRYPGMRPALRPLYCLPVGDHCALTLRLQCGRTVDLVFFDGAGICGSVGVWSLAGHAVHFVVAGDA